jgi:hypothetical protein
MQIVSATISTPFGVVFLPKTLQEVRYYLFGEGKKLLLKEQIFCAATIAVTV